MRRAIAMIELIFAISVMGIVLMSVPMLITTATRSAQTAFKQESIAITASHANALMSYAWDEQNTQSQLPQQQNWILATQSTVTELINRPAAVGNPGAKRRPGTAQASPASSFGPGKDQELDGQTEENASKDDVDDFDGTTVSLDSLETAVTQKGDYIDTNLTLSTSVIYGGDSANYPACATSNGCAFSQPFTTAATGTSNIKQVTVNFTSSDTDTKIQMRFFMCNIGTADIDSGVF